MIFYRLEVLPEDGTTRSCDEWFSGHGSLEQARKRRAEIGRERSPEDWRRSRDLAIEKVKVRELGKRELALAILRDDRWQESTEIVIPPWPEKCDG